MSRSVYFITHPNVVISHDVPVSQWPLSDHGRARMQAGLQQPWIKGITSVYCSTEQKAIDGAQMLSAHLSINVIQRRELGENDRSATGFLPPAEFEEVANQFFAESNTSIRGWERAIDAQTRIVRAVEEIISADTRPGDIAIVSHGAVGTLLYCHLAGERIDRRWDQAPNGGGNYFRLLIASRQLESWWRAIDEAVV